MTSQPEIAHVKLDHKSLQTAAETLEAELLLIDSGKSLERAQSR